MFKLCGSRIFLLCYSIITFRIHDSVYVSEDGLLKTVSCVFVYPSFVCLRSNVRRRTYLDCINRKEKSLWCFKIVKSHVYTYKYCTFWERVCVCVCVRVLVRERPSLPSIQSVCAFFLVICGQSGCIVQLKCDGTRRCTGGELKGKLANGVGSQYSSHYLGTWCIQHYYRWWAHLDCQ